MSGGRRAIIAGNWKMNGLRADGLALVDALKAGFGAARPARPEVVLCPPATLLAVVADRLVGSLLELGAQDCHPERTGAHTGDVSAAMLADLGCTFVILGHSERRANHGETDDLVRAKARAALAEGLAPIICVGETQAERDGGNALTVVATQLAESAPKGAPSDRLLIAYEPVWAIGTGRTPTTAQVAEVHGFIRQQLASKVSDPARVRLLYGGSVKAANARELMTIPDVDGALVGGASLKAGEFLAIVAACPS